MGSQIPPKKFQGLQGHDLPISMEVNAGGMKMVEEGDSRQETKRKKKPLRKKEKANRKPEASRGGKKTTRLNRDLSPMKR